MANVRISEWKNKKIEEILTYEDFGTEIVTIKIDTFYAYDD